MTRSDALILIEYIRQSSWQGKNGYNPNDWEKGFMESIKRCDRITDKQATTLQNIYAKCTGGGMFVKKEKGCV